MSFLRLMASLMICANSVLAFVFSIRGMKGMFGTTLARSDQAFAIESLPPSEVALIVLLYPTMSVSGVVTALLLGWGGARALPVVRDSLRWRERNRVALGGLAWGGVVSLVALFAAPTVPVQSTQNGFLPPAPTSGFVTLVVLGVVGMTALLALLLDPREGESGEGPVSPRKLPREEPRSPAGDGAAPAADGMPRQRRTKPLEPSAHHR